jgi:hypothetical protein
MTHDGFVPPLVLRSHVPHPITPSPPTLAKSIYVKLPIWQVRKCT